MNIPSALTLDMLRTLDALAREGTLARAGKRLGKQPSAVVYALAQLEAQLELPLLDRSGYRTRLNPAGEAVLAQARRVLAELEALAGTVARLRDGWEPTLRVVVDGVVPAEPLLRAIRHLAAEAPTRVELQVAFLAGVEHTFASWPADLMLSVLPPLEATLTTFDLAPLPTWLVCAPGHALARGRVGPAELADHVLVTVRGSDPRLVLPTAPLEAQAPIVLHDFATKRTALLEGLGYGWMPAHLVAEDLAAQRLVRVDFTGGNAHVLQPRAATRGVPGRAAARLLAGLAQPG